VRNEKRGISERRKVEIFESKQTFPAAIAPLLNFPAAAHFFEKRRLSQIENRKS
jgi:hypothetical protein